MTEKIQNVQITAEQSSGVIYGQLSHETDKAYCVDFLGIKKYIPKSQVKDMYGGEPIEIAIENWLFKKLLEELEGVDI